MKTILIFLTLLVSSFHVFAQETFTDMDSMIYGSPQIKEYEEGIRWRFSHRLGGVFIGYNSNYADRISLYLQQQGYVSHDVPGGKNFTSYYLTPTGANRMPKAFIKMVVYYNEKTYNTSQILITGTPDELAQLFLFYWEFSKISINLLKSGGYLFQNCGSDRITFDWKGKLPIIRVLKNPDGIRPKF